MLYVLNIVSGQIRHLVNRKNQNKRNWLLIQLIFLVFFIGLLSSCASKNNHQRDSSTFYQFPEKGKYATSTVEVGGIEYKQLLSGVPGKYGGRLTSSISGNPKTFNPWASTDSTSAEVSGMMFAGLIERDPWTGDIKPNLAKSFEIKDDGKEIIVHLRKGILWSDGKPITSEDVIFTWNTILKDGFERLGAKETIMVDEKFPEIKALDKYTISFKTERVFAPLLSELSYAIAPAHFFRPLLDNVSKQALKENPKATNEEILAKQKQIFSATWGTDLNPKDMIVSGSYRLHAYKFGERIEYEPNPNYFVVDIKKQRLPYIKKYTVLILPDNDLEIFKFLSGEIPILGLDSETLPLIKSLKAKKPFKLYKRGPADTSVFIAFNMSRRGNVSKEVSTWFNNADFRKALSVAIDRQAMIDSIYLGIGSPLCLSTTGNSIYFNKELNKECSANPNLAEAEKILKKAGFTKNKNGLLTDSKGNQVKFRLYTNAGSAFETNSPRELMAVLIKEQWKKLGIEADLKVIEFNNLVVRLMQTGDWETVIMGLTGGDLFEPNNSANFLYSDSRLHLFDQREAGKPITDKRDWEKEIDSLVGEGTKYIEFEKRKKYYHRIQEILWKENPMLYLITPQTILAIQSDNIGNFYPSKLSGPSYNQEQWFFKN